MYFRDTSAIFFTFIFPVIFLVVFGYINSSDTITLDVAYYNDKTSQQTTAFDEAFRTLVKQDGESEEQMKGKLFKLTEETISVEEAKEKLADAQLNAIIVVPDNFGATGSGEIEIYVDESDATFGEITKNAIAEILDEYNKQANIQKFGAEPIAPYTVMAKGVQSDNLGPIDYLVPGIIGFSIMSLGIFSITEGFIQLKTDGSLRRLKITPIKPSNFLVAQSLTRLVVTLLNVVTMLVIGALLFDFEMRGDLASFLLVSVLGIAMFLGVGYAIAGWAKDGNQAAPLSNIIFFPMMFLSGTFFPRELFPTFLQPITDFIPLTFLSDALREIANNASTIFDVGPELLGMGVWTVVIYTIAFRVFRWE